MAIAAIHSFLVHPGKNADDVPPLSGTRVNRSDAAGLVKMLEEIYAKADAECTIDISFNRAANGTQQNDCRDLVLAYAQHRRIDDGRALALRLQGVTTNRSRLGLLFLMAGDEDQYTKLVVSRFPADSGVLAEQSAGSLSVQFLERIFMKSAFAYKSAVYRDRLSSTSFWTGKAIDRQSNSGTIAISDYWIKDFLASDFRTTSVAGTRRLADALRTATADAADVTVKGALIAAAQLARGLDGKTTSITDFMATFALSEPAQDVLRRQVRNPALLSEQFRVDAAEFERRLPLRTIHLDNGGILTAPAPKFDEVFIRETVADGRQRFTTEGQVVDEVLRRRS
ncbi:MAG TPA: hypothetical protein VHO06_27555 [Polyangia bacterium]|nr:hypothetical protein [Polyangia bacterium]